jgi:hypothetical protein
MITVRLGCTPRRTKKKSSLLSFPQFLCEKKYGVIRTRSGAFTSGDKSRAGLPMTGTGTVHFRDADGAAATRE